MRTIDRGAPVLATALLALTGACVGAGHRVTVGNPPRRPVTQTMDERIEVTSPVTIVVSSDAGPVNIEAGDANAVSVLAEKHAPADADLQHMKVTVRQDGATVRATYSDDELVRSNRYVAFRITAPASSQVRVQTAGGSIAVRRMQGGAELSTAGGSIETVATTGTLGLRTAGGSVSATGIDGSIDAQTSGGTASVSGNLRGDNEVRATGEVRVRVPRSANLTVDAQGLSAFNDFGIPVDRGRMQGTIGNGKAGTLRMRADAGTVRLEAA